jgi:hypothetical protein
VTDEDGVGVGTERIVESDRIMGECGHVVVAVGRNVGGCIAAHERSYRSVTSVGERGQEVPPAVG